jgi:hypothetical protein
MRSYAEQLLEMVNAGLADLATEHKAGKLANTSVVNTNFILRWISKSIKQKRFETLMAKNLMAWQKQGRSQGTKTNMYQTFTNISDFYGLFFPQGNYEKPVLDTQINQLMDAMEALGWSVNNEFDLTGTAKSHVFTDGDSSFVMCADECESCFAGAQEGDEIEELVRPMSFYIRGHHVQFIEQAARCGLMLHKRTDYKSKVKYHGEYLVYPKNQGLQIAEMPLGFKATDYQ